MAQQIFVRSKMQQEARWPKVTDPKHPLKDHNHARMKTMDSKEDRWDWSREGNNIRLRDNGLPNVHGNTFWREGRGHLWNVQRLA